jgi:hypothetical protein
MRIDHIVVHIDKDAEKFDALSSAINDQGFPFNPNAGKRSLEYRVSNINIGNEYIELVRIMRSNAPSWMPLWTHHYNNGQRGVFCIFLEVEDVERLAVAIKKGGIRARGPAVLTYPSLLGLYRTETPYFIYYLPNFPDTPLQFAIMQYKKASLRESSMAGLQPNAEQNGIHGIRKVEIEMPNLDENMEMLQRLFSELRSENEQCFSMLDKQRIIFRRSADQQAHVRVSAVTSQRAYLGKKFHIENLEVVTIGG